MPPPKKPKSGRTSLEQFLSDEERSTLTARRDSASLRDSEGNSPVGSLDLESSDGEVFDGKAGHGEDSCKSKDSVDVRNSLFQKLFRKSQSADEQKVPGSPEEEVPSPVSSPNGESDRLTAFKKYQEHIQSGVYRKVVKDEKCRANGTVSPDKLVYAGSEPRDHTTAGGQDTRTLNLSCKDGVRVSADQGRLIDTLVASALASSAAQSIIYNQRALQDTAYTRAHGETPGQHKTYDSGPHDLSKRSEVDAKLVSHRLYNDNLNNTGDPAQLSQAYREWYASREGKDHVTVERNQHYLESHRNIVELLSERAAGGASQRPPDGTPVQTLDKENIVQTVPARYPNGFFHVGLNYSRYEQHQRESLERAMGKVDSCGNLMSPSSYLPVGPMMPPVTSSLGQNSSPGGGTMEMGDPRERYHPALLNPHLMSDTRRVKQENNHGASVNKLCQVCNDNASGFHYGVWSCEGCKAFFKRSIQGPVDYVCPATNTCTIDKHRRKSCQACRLRKCYEVGMNKGSQRKERKASGAANNKSLKRPSGELVDSSSGSSNSVPHSPAKNPRKSRTSVILEALSKADMPSLESHHNHSLPPTRTHLLTSLVKLAERELVFLINWAKNVPGYTELSLGDQVHLIECCWMELLLLNCAFRSMEHGGRRLAFAPDLVLERPYWLTVGMSEVLEQVAAVSEQMLHYSLHREELLLLQATVLANAEVRKLASYNKLREIQASLLDCLVDTAQKYHPDNLRHIPALLLLLTHIRQAAERATTFFQSLKNEGCVTFCDLLTEMLDAQNEDRNKVAAST